MKRPRPGTAWGLLSIVLLLAAGCGPAGKFGRPERIPTGDMPWEIPSSALGSQRLYRVSYQGPEGKLAFRLTLYLETPESFRMDAADGVGRRIFSLEVGPPPAAPAAAAGGGQALWLDHRNKEYCRLESSGLPRDLPLANLPLEALPRLLLGMMPAQPKSELARAGGKISYLDGAGRHWSGSLDAGGLLEWWTLVEAGEAIAWWQRQPEETIYSDRLAGLQVRLQQQVVEPLKAKPSRLEIPAGYAESACGRPR
jgi:hypothetical protein